MVAFVDPIGLVDLPQMDDSLGSRTWRELDSISGLGPKGSLQKPCGCWRGPIPKPMIELSDYFTEQYHYERPSYWTHQGTIASVFCGDQVVLFVTIEDSVVRGVWHTTTGCLVAQAAASFVCQWAEGRTLDRVHVTTEHEFLALVGPLTPMRQQCALLPFRCLKQLLPSLRLGEGCK